MKKLINFLMLSCRNAAALIDRKAEVNLSWRENVQLYVHKMMCDACTAYEKQNKLIDKAQHKYFHAMDEDVNVLIENKELQKQIILEL